MTITAIPTEWNGNEYRSKLEARWAIFLDALGFRHHYETQGFELTHDWSGRPGKFKYLPDIYIEDLRWWTEIKPVWSVFDCCRYLDAAMALMHAGTADGFLLLGEIPSDYHGDVYSPIVLRRGHDRRRLIASPWFTSGAYGEQASRELVPGFVDAEVANWLLRGQKIKACDQRFRDAMDRARCKRLGWA